MPLGEEEFTDPTLEKALSRDGAGIKKPEEEDSTPLYRVIGKTKIPVSKSMGGLWQARRDQGLSGRRDAETCWDEAIRYYDNDQTGHRKAVDNQAGNTRFSKRLNNQLAETENVVFANCSIMVPMLYAKNPNITVTFESDAYQALSKCLERLGNKLMHKKTAPGLNFKNKIRRSVLTALLTNNAFIKIGWIFKQDSSEDALAELQSLATELENAKDKKTIKEIEGKIMALEETVDMLSPAGPLTRALLPHRVIVDPTSMEPDGSDANWMMEWDMLPTSYINAVYGVKNDQGKVASVYEPSHVLQSGATTGDGVDDEVNNFTLIKDQSSLKANAYGYSSKEQLDAASYTKVWWVWDKATRRVYMFADNNWKWPIWVWDDPLRLPRFFPYFRLWFHESTNSNSPKGEVTYYLDQQDAINSINDETARGRQWAKRNLFYDKKSISQEDVEAVLSGPDGTAKGVDLGEGMTLDKAIMSITPPSLKFPELFNTDSKFAAINRITGINDAMRGAQFKTNTTNKAVEAYQGNVDIRVDERVDLIEDFIGDIMWNILILCLLNWDIEQVAELVGQEVAQAWKRITDPKQIDSVLQCRVEGGSIAKPNSKEKKKQAIELLQVFGQFASAAPAIIVPMIKMVQNAFDEVVVSDEDMAMILQTMMAQFQKAGAGPGGEQQQQAPEDPNAQPAQSDEQLKEQLKQQIAQLPPQGQQMLEQLVKQGMPPAQALQEVQKQVQAAVPK